MEGAHGARPIVLGRGAHLNPDDGACLMEAVSVAAGLSWTDAPSCTLPLLAHLARLVNDASSDPARTLLVDLVGVLADSRPQDASTRARASAVLAHACSGYALELRWTPYAQHLRDRAEREVRRAASPRSTSRWARARAAVFEYGPGARAVEAAVHAVLRLPNDDRDAALGALLRSGIAAVRHELDASPDPVPTAAPAYAEPAAG